MRDNVIGSASIKLQYAYFGFFLHFRRLTMGFFSTLFNGFLRSGSQGAASVIGIPGLAAAAELLVAIVIICDNVPQNKCVHEPSHCPSLSDTLTGVPLAS